MKQFRPVTAALVAAAALAGCSSGPTRSAASSASAVPAPPTTCSATPAASYGGKPIAYGAQAAVADGGALGVTATRPTVTPVPADKAGFQVVQVPVRTAVITNGTFAVAETQVMLLDGSGHACAQPSVNNLPGGFSAVSVDETRGAAGSVAFLVPRGADLSRYRVRYLPAPGAKTAAAEWSSTGSKPSVPASAGCDGAKSTIRTTGATSKAFGSVATVGDATVSLDLDPATPTRRRFTPGASQPNNVDAIDVRVQVKADGADGFVQRSQFALVDGSGRLCRSAQLGSQGETLTSALVKAGGREDYTITFWLPKTAKVSGLKLLYSQDPSAQATVVWTGGKDLPPLS